MIEGNQSFFVFGDFLHLRGNPALGSIENFFKVYQQLIQAEHEILAVFAAFFMDAEYFEIPKQRDNEHGLENINLGFYWESFGEFVGDGYDENFPGPGYIRVNSKKQSINVVITLYDYEEDECFGGFLEKDYMKQAEKVWRIEIEKFHNVNKKPRARPGNSYYFAKSFPLFYEESANHDKGSFFYCPELDKPQEEIDVYNAVEKEKYEKELQEAKRLMSQDMEYKGFKPAVVLVDPRIIEGNEEEYVKNKNQLQGEYGWDILKTPWELMETFKTSSAKYDKWHKYIRDRYEIFFEEYIYSSQQTLFKSYLEKCEKLYNYWSYLEKQSQEMFSFGEILFDSLKTVEANYSICVNQFCNVLENELRKKVFNKLMETLRDKYSSDERTLKDFLKELQGGKGPIIKKSFITGEFVSLGEIGVILGNVSVLKSKFNNPIAKDILGYLKYYLPFDENMMLLFSKEIKKVNEYRKRAAHPDPKHCLNQKEANMCKVTIIGILNRLFKAIESV